MKELKNSLKNAYEKSVDKIKFINDLREYIFKELSPLKEQPVDFVRWIDIEKIQPNDYNPNSVAKVEMGLLYKSIKHDGYTQPTVVIYDKSIDKYIIVDGFHRYFICKYQNDIKQKNMNCLPVVVIEKDINERMASTIRHNRARGMHSVDGMSNMVFKMLENGMKDEDICNELGMDAEEILKLKHITGFSKLFDKVDYNKAWITKTQVDINIKYKNNESSRKTDGVN